MAGSAGWITLLPTRFARSFTSSARYVCPHIAGENSHRRHIEGTPVTHDRPAIYAPYALYVPPMLSADAAVNASFGYEASRRTAQSIRLSIIGPRDSLFGRFSEGVPTQFLIGRNSFHDLSFWDMDPLKQCQIVPNSAISTALHCSDPLPGGHSPPVLTVRTRTTVGNKSTLALACDRTRVSGGTWHTNPIVALGSAFPLAS